LQQWSSSVGREKPKMISEAVEDYLKAIYLLKGDGASVSTNAIANRLEVAPASVTQMIKKLDLMRPKLVEYRRHYGVSLTPNGEKIALEVIRHHRLIELFLQEALGMSWDEVDREAERLEHVISPKLADRISAALGDPKYDPHGDPIPSKGGTLPPEDNLLQLSEMREGQTGIVRRVIDHDAEMLRYLAGMGVQPGAQVMLLEKAPFDGPLHVRVGRDGNSGSHALGRIVSEQVFIEAQ